MRRFLTSVLSYTRRLFVAPPPSPELQSLHHATRMVVEASERLDASVDKIGTLVRDMRRGPRRRKPAGPSARKKVKS